MNQKKQLKKKLVALESDHFELYNELKDLDDLLKKIGFPLGISSLKKVGKKILSEQNDI